MKTTRTALLTLALAAALTGCNAGRDEAASAAETMDGAIETNVRGAMDEARRELETGNITLDASGAPKAEITPKGDLLIDGKPVPVNAEQRALLLEYRGHVAAVATAGMDVGLAGARLATTAVKEALQGVFTGDADKVGERVEKQAEPIRQAALKLCDRLPAMHATQQKLAAALPAFAPYANMDVGDIEDCRRDVMDGKPPAPPTPPAPPAPPVPPAGKGQAASGPGAKDVIGKPELPDLPELPDPTG